MPKIINIVFKENQQLTKLEIELYSNSVLQELSLIEGVIEEMETKTHIPFEPDLELALVTKKEKENLNLDFFITNYNDINTLNKTYIVNKEEDVAGVELGVYVDSKNNDSYELLDIKEFAERNNLKKEAIERFKESNLLESRKVALNGTLGKFINDTTITNLMDYTETGVNKINKKDFSENLKFFVNSEVEAFKQDNDLSSLTVEELDELVNEQDFDKVGITEDGDYFILKIDEENSLHLAISTDGKSVFEGSFFEKDVFINNEKTNEKIRLRSLDEPNEQDLYIDSSLAGFDKYLKKYKVNKIEEDKILTEEKLAKHSKMELILLKKKNKQDLVDLLKDVMPKDLDFSIDIESFYRTQIKIAINGNMSNDQSHKLYLNSEEEGLKISMTEGVISGSNLESFALKTKIYKATEKVIKFLKENKKDLNNIIKNNEVIEKVAYDVDLMEQNSQKNKKKKTRKPK